MLIFSRILRPPGWVTTHTIKKCTTVDMASKNYTWYLISVPQNPSIKKNNANVHKEEYIRHCVK